MDLTRNLEPTQPEDDDRYIEMHYSGRDTACVSNPTSAMLKAIKSNGSSAADRVRAFYNSGVPFFTKDAIADLAAQLNRARISFQHEGTSIGNNAAADSHVRLFSLQGLDGEKVEVENELGNVTAWTRDSSTEHVMVDFVIHYRTYQDLTRANKDRDNFTALAYCPLRVYYRAQSRHIDTKVFRTPPEGKPFKTTQVAFHAGIKAWEDSEECEKLRNSLMTSIVPDKITKIIAFACCTISSNRQIFRQISTTQHALVLTIKDILQKKNLKLDEEIRLYAQDPVYTDVDKAVLEAAGIHVLDDPYGFLEVDDSSIVISFSPNVPVRQIVADIAHPAIMIWNKVKPEEEMVHYWSKTWKEGKFENVEELEGSICDPESSRLREMVENQYIEIYNFSGQIFGHSCVYVRRC